MSKIYFSRSMTRSMSADHPVGDPTGGVAYGEKNDPVSAALSIATMAGTYAQIGTTITLMQGLTMAGAALSLVGNITGNKTLSKIGMVAGVVGGLGQMGAFGETAKGATWDSTFGGTSTPPSSVTAPTVGNQTPVREGVQTGTTTVAGDGNRVAAFGQSDLANAQIPTGGGLGVSNQVNVNGMVPAPDIQPSAAISNQTPVSGGFESVTNPAQAGQTGSGWQYFKDAGGQSAAISPEGKYFLNGEQVTGAAGGKFGVSDYAKMAWEGTKDIGAGFMNFAKDNPYGALAVGQIAQPIADYLSGKTDAEIDALKAQTGYADANALRIQEEIAKEKRRRENLSAGYAQVNTGITVNAPKQGLIAQQMPQA